MEENKLIGNLNIESLFLFSLNQHNVNKVTHDEQSDSISL
jgi:hypothetical protein